MIDNIIDRAQEDHESHTFKNSGVMLWSLCKEWVRSYVYEKYKNGEERACSNIETYILLSAI